MGVGALCLCFVYVHFDCVFTVVMLFVLPPPPVLSLFSELLCFVLLCLSHHVTRECVASEGSADNSLKV